MNLDKKLFFKNPKLIKRYHINENKDYYSSLEKSVFYFLNHVFKKKNFSKKNFRTSLSSNNFIL